ncbi:60S ribosomal protein L14 [Anopheles funestus]|uniref:Large ribosomal subunit protein eL14 n=1 Tax=Anopheles funestus TaxID=62324 RepID=A0A182S551_ANOFN|nr:60S ribosomal protein L14 [Anopheles funestus]
MSFTRFVETGRVAKCAVGKYKGRLVCIVNVIDQNRVLIDGPTSGVPRQQYAVNHLHLTKFRVRFPHTARTRVVRDAIEKFDLKKKFEETRWNERSVAKGRRYNMNDFDRFKLRLARRERNLIVSAQYKKLKKVVVRNGMLFGKPRKGTKPLPPKREKKPEDVKKPKKKKKLPPGKKAAAPAKKK